MIVYLVIEDVQGQKSRVVGAYRDDAEAAALMLYMDRTSVGTMFTYRIVTTEVK